MGVDAPPLTCSHLSCVCLSFLLFLLFLGLLGWAVWQALLTCPPPRQPHGDRRVGKELGRRAGAGTEGRWHFPETPDAFLGCWGACLLANPRATGVAHRHEPHSHPHPTADSWSQCGGFPIITRVRKGGETHQALSMRRSHLGSMLWVRYITSPQSWQ